mmetsp:Transcript_58261/g.103962  ORF Transcript_58261/g.103962 Transcript_58261/m.103962 type:complete len:300 (-) Transcript_58261:673-1572(-)
MYLLPLKKLRHILVHLVQPQGIGQVDHTLRPMQAGLVLAVVVIGAEHSRREAQGRQHDAQPAGQGLPPGVNRPGYDHSPCAGAAAACKARHDLPGDPQNLLPLQGLRAAHHVTPLPRPDGLVQIADAVEPDASAPLPERCMGIKQDREGRVHGAVLRRLGRGDPEDEALVNTLQLKVFEETCGSCERPLAQGDKRSALVQPQGWRDGVLSQDSQVGPHPPVRGGGMGRVQEDLSDGQVHFHQGQHLLNEQCDLCHCELLQDPFNPFDCSKLQRAIVPGHGRSVFEAEGMFHCQLTSRPQ